MTTLSLHGIAYALIFLALGVVELYVFLRAIYPVLSERHETLKVTYSQGRSPAFITSVIRFQSLVLMPLLGYFVGAFILQPGSGAN